MSIHWGTPAAPPVRRIALILLLTPSTGMTGCGDRPAGATDGHAVIEADEGELIRRHAPAVQRPAPDSLIITAQNGTRHVFADDVVDGEARAAHRLAAAPAGLPVFVVIRQYIPEGRAVLMVDRRTGDVIEIDDLPVPSPDGSRFATASLDLVAGHSPNRVRIYRTAGTDRPVVEAELEPREWGARNPIWLDAGTLRLERGVVDWNRHELLTSPMIMRRDGGRWTIEPSGEHARDVLLSFLSALGLGHYMEATQYYGGSYELLRTWNPDIPATDLTALWSAACERNGLQCLARAEVVAHEAASATDTQFTVRLFDDAGQPFVLGPCCGETEESMPPQPTFTFRVRRVEDRYLVLDTPPYMP